MIYRTKRCPRCRNVVEQSAGYADDLTNHIGSPIDVCGHCGSQYGTGRKYWSDMSSAERRKIHWLLTAGAIVGGFKVAVLLAMALGAIYVSVFGFQDDSKSTPMSNSEALRLWGLLYIIGLLYAAHRKIKSLAESKKLGTNAPHKSK